MYIYFISLFLGQETSAGTLTSCTYFLGKNPEALQKCYDEIMNVSEDGELDASGLEKLKYMDAVINEALRYSFLHYQSLT